MSPYRHNGKNYFRVTEILAAIECENTAYQIKKGDPKRPRESHAVVIPGTFLHYRIAKFLSEQQGVEPPSVPVLNDGLKKILEMWRKLKIIDEKLHMLVADGFDNFMHFWNSYKIKPLAIEKTMFHSFEHGGRTYDIGGTVDLIALVTLKGVIEDDGLFYQCNHVQPDPLCECEVADVITIMDWKFSLRPHPNHKTQLTVYRWEAEETGVLDDLKRRTGAPLNAVNWSVLLRSRALDPSHQIWKYESDFEAFFEGCHILDDPQPRTRNWRTGHEGVKMRCSFCPERWNCPDIGVWTPSSAYDDTVVVD